MKFLNLNQIQNQPLAVRMRFLWTITGILAVILFGIWLYSTANNVKKTDTDLGLMNNIDKQAETVHTSIRYVTVDWIEHNNNQLKVYFQVTNSTNNILSFSKAENITLTTEEKIYTTKYLQDRQGSPFAIKILSTTQKFGVVIFDDVTVDSAQIKFDNLYFENDIDSNFNQTIELDLKALNKPIEIGQ